MVLSVLFSLMVVRPLHADIGSITELEGSGRVVRDDAYAATLAFDIDSYDNVQTSNGRLGITFLDDSQVRLTEHSQLIIDEYIYDPDPSKSKMALQFASGTIRFVTSSLGKINKENINLSTPTANIAIRGTDFTCTVDELGRSLIILLPDAEGLSSGEILVSTATGTVVLNKPFQATSVSVFENSPSKPVILDLTLDLIDNMLIVTPPKEDPQFAQEVSTTSSSSFLEFNDLDIDYLNEDFLDAEDELEFTELDINYLDVNFLEDLLDVLDVLQVDEEEDKLKDVSGFTLVGTQIGQDADTQITTIVQGQTISLRRTVESSFRLDTGSDESFTLIIIQDGVSHTIKVNGGGSSTIKVRQGS